MSDRDEIQYLKAFVKQHPDNRMAWYLLGKAYTQQGKPGKANYCYLQAREVYEAYERKRHPIVQQQKELIAAWGKKRQRQQFLRRGGLLAALLLLVFIGSPDLTGQLSSQAASGADKAAEGAETAGLAETAGPGETAGLAQVAEPAEALEAAEAEDNPELTLLYTREASKEVLTDATVELLYGETAVASAQMAAIALPEERGYRMWSLAKQPLLQVEREAGSAAATLMYFDPNLCVCEPADAAGLLQQAKNWERLQEERWVLTSAIHHFQIRNARLPEQLEELVQPYPNNYLAGDTVWMRESFEEVRDEWSQRQQTQPQPDQAKLRQYIGQNSGSTTGQVEAGASTSAMLLGLSQAPLEIVVDRSTYTLAVISGNVIIRSYRVGLGGERTPEGVFEITEKVKNPNDRDDGEFGSRGMTLSNTLYAIHGTNEPDSIGKDESLGCVRMNQEELEEVYDLVSLGTRVTITSGVLPEAGGVLAGELLPEAGEASVQRFKLTPRQQETNPGVVYRWLGH